MKAILEVFLHNLNIIYLKANFLPNFAHKNHTYSLAYEPDEVLVF